jgi:hypothetical protein
MKGDTEIEIITPKGGKLSGIRCEIHDDTRRTMEPQHLGEAGNEHHDAY